MTYKWNAMEAKLLAMIKNSILAEVNTIVYRGKLFGKYVNMLVLSVSCHILYIVTRRSNLTLKSYFTARKKMGDITLTGVG
jgi:hypothetical protein